MNVTPPSWRLHAGWKPALRTKLGHYLFAAAFERNAYIDPAHASLVVQFDVAAALCRQVAR